MSSSSLPVQYTILRKYLSIIRASVKSLEKKYDSAQQTSCAFVSTLARSSRDCRPAAVLMPWPWCGGNQLLLGLHVNQMRGPSWSRGGVERVGRKRCPPWQGAVACALIKRHGRHGAVARAHGGTRINTQGRCRAWRPSPRPRAMPRPQHGPEPTTRAARGGRPHALRPTWPGTVAPWRRADVVHGGTGRPREARGGSACTVLAHSASTPALDADYQAQPI